MGTTPIGPRGPNLPADEGGTVVNENAHPHLPDVNSVTTNIDSAGNAKDTTAIGPRDSANESLDSYDPTATTP